MKTCQLLREALNKAGEVRRNFGFLQKKPEGYFLTPTLKREELSGREQ
jgi:hypothetical protein